MPMNPSVTNPGGSPGITSASFYSTPTVLPVVRFTEFNYILYDKINPDFPWAESEGRQVVAYSHTGIPPIQDIADIEGFPKGMVYNEAFAVTQWTGLGLQFETRLGPWTLDSQSIVRIRFEGVLDGQAPNEEDDQRLSVDIVTSPVPLPEWVDKSGEGVNPNNPWHQTRTQLFQQDITNRAAGYAPNTFGNHTLTFPTSSYATLNAITSNPSYNGWLGFLIRNEPLTASTEVHFLTTNMNQNGILENARVMLEITDAVIG